MCFYSYIVYVLDPLSLHIFSRITNLSLVSSTALIRRLKLTRDFPFTGHRRYRVSFKSFSLKRLHSVLGQDSYRIAFLPAEDIYVQSNTIIMPYAGGLLSYKRCYPSARRWNTARLIVKYLVTQIPSQPSEY